MAIPMAAMMGAGALMGGMGGKQQSKGKTTSSWTDMYNKGQGDALMGNYNDAMNRAAGIDFGPTADQTALYRNMMNQAMGGQGGGGGGGGGFQSQWGKRGGGGGGGGQGIEKRLAKNNVALSDYESKVLSDYYLDLENNPYIQQQLDAMQREGQESFEQTAGAAMSPFLQAGGTMGFTGANLGTRARMADEHGENMANTRANYLGQQYANERALQDSANQAWGQREATYDSSAFSADATRKAAAMAARASMYNTDSQRYLGEKQIGAQSAAQAWAQKMGMYGIADQYAAQQRQGQGLGEMGVYGQGMSQTLPWQSGFGKSYQKTPGSSGLGGFLQGAIGGAMGGAGMGKGMGGKGGGGGVPGLGSAMSTFNMNPTFGPTMSDARMKRDIVRLDAEYMPGVPLATWTWPTGEPGFGVIAQDLELVAPERVVEINGIKHVRLGG